MDEVCTVIIRAATGKQIRQIMDLYLAQGWWHANDDGNAQLINRLIAGSHCFAIAMEKDDIVGIGRAISDGISDAYVQDLTVRLDRRRRGIGRRILQTLVERLLADGLTWIGIIAEPGSFDLYRGAGFHQMTGCVPMLMKQKP